MRNNADEFCMVIECRLLAEHGIGANQLTLPAVSIGDCILGFNRSFLGHHFQRQKFNSSKQRTFYEFDMNLALVTVQSCAVCMEMYRDQVSLHIPGICLIAAYTNLVPIQLCILKNQTSSILEKVLNYQQILSKCLSGLNSKITLLDLEWKSHIAH